MKKKLLLALSVVLGTSIINIAVADPKEDMAPALVAAETCNKEQTHCGVHIGNYGTSLQTDFLGKPVKTLQPGDRIKIMGLTHTVRGIKPVGDGTGDYLLDFVPEKSEQSTRD